MPSVIVVIGAGSIGQAIACRVGAGKPVRLADLRQDNKLPRELEMAWPDR
jgi:3-hydroxyacyl-CoA dehydrogenase